MADCISIRDVDKYVTLSVSPADILTSSNPKHHKDGEMLVSCHSLDNIDYTYRSGNTGYCNDKYTAILFTTDKMDDKSRYTRKTDRQLYFIQDNCFIQSRLYGTGGGMGGITEKHKIFRNCVQDILAKCWNVENSWKWKKITNDNRYDIISKNVLFGGYADWEYDEFSPILSYLKDKEYHKFENVGGESVCLICGKRCLEGIVHRDCMESSRCYMCGNTDGNLTRVRSNGEGRFAMLCDNCLEHYRRCSNCGEYEYVDCLDENNVCEYCRRNENQ